MGLNPTGGDSRRAVWHRVGSAVVVVLAVRLSYLVAAYLLATGSTRRFHVESAALAFAIAGVCFKAIHDRQRDAVEGASTPPAAIPSWSWILLCACAVALYWPALSLGFLSDDFVLVDRAMQWNVTAVTPELFRPLPMLGWALLLHTGAGAGGLHLLSLLLHGTNAYLTTRLVAQWVPDVRWSIAAGLLVLAAPLSPEAVVWCSGVFDVAATTLVLASILIARKYATAPSFGTRLQFAIATVAAVLSKETAAIGPALVGLDGWTRRRLPRSLWMDAGVLAAVIVLFSAIRLRSAFGAARLPISKFLVQRGVFGVFGGLAVPWHADVVSRFPWLPIIGSIAVIFLVTVFFIERSSRRRIDAVAAGVAWLLIAILPVWPILAVGTDLQQSRYLYLPAIGWAALLVTMAAPTPTRPLLVGRLAVAAVVAVIALGAWGTRLHLRPWIEAAGLRDRVEAAARRDERLNACGMITLQDLPDSVKGAYVFRNGTREAFARDLHLDVTVGPARTDCSFRWDAERMAFVPRGAD
jgi:hypothetical protein